MTDDTWKVYFENTKNQPPRPLLVRAVGFVESKSKALDLGAGALNDSVYLLANGFSQVTALDKEAVALEVASKLSKDRFNYVICDFESFDFPKSEFDVITAQYSLPFILPSRFEEVFGKIVQALKPGGVLVGQLFGDRDEWKDNNQMNFHTKEEVERILSGLQVVEFAEEEQDRLTAANKMKHWHVFSFIARK